MASHDSEPFRGAGTSSGGGAPLDESIRKIAESGAKTVELLNKIAAASGVPSAATHGSSGPAVSNAIYGSGTSAVEMARLRGANSSSLGWNRISGMSAVEMARLREKYKDRYSGGSSVPLALGPVVGSRPSSGIKEDPYSIPNLVKKGTIYGLAKKENPPETHPPPSKPVPPRPTYGLVSTDVHPPEWKSWVDAIKTSKPGSVKTLGGTAPTGGGSFGWPSMGGSKEEPSKTPAFDRPISVIVMGPKPLPVSIVGGTGSSGPGGPKEPKEEKEPSGLGTIAKLAIAGAVTSHIAHQVTSAGNIVQDPFSTQEQKQRSLAKLLPGGGTVLGLADMISGRSAEMAMVGLGGQHRRAEVHGRVEEASFMLQYQPRQAGLEATARTYAGQGAITPGIHERTTAAGKTDYENAMRLLPLRKETARAERDVSSATATRMANEKQLLQLQAKENGLIHTRNELQAKLNKGGSGAAFQQLVESHHTVTDEIAATNSQVRQVRHAVAESTTHEAQARGEFQKAKIREDKLGDAANLEAKAQRIGTTASRLGGMDPFSQQRALTGIKHLQSLKSEAELQATPQDVLEEARQAFPEAVDEVVRKLTQGGAAFQQAQRQGGLETYVGKPGETEAGLLRQAGEKTEEAGKGEHAVDVETAKAAAAAGADLGKFVSDAIQRFVENAKNAIMRELLDARNAS